MKTVLAVVAALVAGLVLYAVGQAWKLKPETKYERRVMVGEVAFVKAAQEEVVKLEPDGIEVTVGTPVKVIREKVEKREVEVMEGPNAGKRGWLLHENLRPRARGEDGR
jgi:plastocyanin